MCPSPIAILYILTNSIIFKPSSLTFREGGLRHRLYTTRTCRKTAPGALGVRAVEDRLDRLIAEGERLVPLGGGDVSTGPNLEFQDDYFAWRSRCVELLTELGPDSEHLLWELQWDTRSKRFFRASASRVLRDCRVIHTGAKRFKVSRCLYRIPMASPGLYLWCASCANSPATAATYRLSIVMFFQPMTSSMSLSCIPSRFI